MKARHGKNPFVATLGLLAASAGCGHSGRNDPIYPSSVPSKGAKVSQVEDAPAPRASARPANRNGKVFILEYHHVGAGKGDMFRSAADFRGDLERLYRDGFRPCTVSAYLNDKLDLPGGASPAVFTFDDAIPTQLRLLPDENVDPSCAVGIWMAFAKKHPDFPVHATFYVLPDVMWGQPKLLKSKVALLSRLGCELANHTVTHPKLKRLSDDQVKAEIAVADDDLAKLGVTLPVSIALPYGISPKNRQLLEDFDYKGKHYHQTAALLVGAGPAPAPTDPKLNRYRIPRIQAVGGPFGLDYWLDAFEKGSVKVYVAP